jgi:disulfide oxidoreductase YuzD
MSQRVVEIAIFGAEQICSSCVHLPSSRETYEWLEAAITRKFPNQPFKFTYTDLFALPIEDEEKKQFAQKVIDEELFYPVILVEGKIVGEGNVRLKTIYSELENYGYVGVEL